MIVIHKSESGLPQNKLTGLPKFVPENLYFYDQLSKKINSKNKLS